MIDEYSRKVFRFSLADLALPPPPPPSSVYRCECGAACINNKQHFSPTLKVTIAYVSLPAGLGGLSCVCDVYCSFPPRCLVISERDVTKLLDETFLASNGGTDSARAGGTGAMTGNVFMGMIWILRSQFLYNITAAVIYVDELL